MSTSGGNTCYFCDKQIYKGAKFCPQCGKNQPTPFTDQEIQKDPYEILQVSKNAEDEVIKSAFKELARKYHPDVNKSQTAEEKMRVINWAYDILSDPEKKARWDKFQHRKKYNDKPKESQSSVTRKEKPKTEYSSGKLIPCPNCGKESPTNTLYCFYCGTSLQEHKENNKNTKHSSTSDEDKKAYQSTQNLIKCPHCGKDNPTKRSICIKCGGSLRKKKDEIKSENKKYTSAKITFFILGVPVFFFCILFASVLILRIVPTSSKVTATQDIVTRTPRPTTTLRPTITPKPTITPPPSSTIKLPYHETFSNPSEIWWTGNDEYGSNKIENGEYVLTPKTANDISLGLTQSTCG